MSLIIQHINIFLFITFTFPINAQEGIVINQFNCDSISSYQYDNQNLKQILYPLDTFLLNIQEKNRTSLISEIPNYLQDFRKKRLKNISVLRDKIFVDSLLYCNCLKEGLLEFKCLYNKENKKIFQYESYNDCTEKYFWFDVSGFKIVSIEIVGSNYEESIFVDNVLIKRIVICEESGYIQYSDLENRVILNLEYIKGKIIKGTLFDHKNKELTTLLW